MFVRNAADLTKIPMVCSQSYAQTFVADGNVRENVPLNNVLKNRKKVNTDHTPVTGV